MRKTTENKTQTVGVDMIDFIGHLRVDFKAAKSKSAAKQTLQMMAELLEHHFCGFGVRVEITDFEATKFLTTELPE